MSINIKKFKAISREILDLGIPFADKLEEFEKEFRAVSSSDIDKLRETDPEIRTLSTEIEELNKRLVGE